MEARSLGDTTGAARLRALAQRCRDLSDLTVIPEVTRELMDIAETLDDEAERIEKQ